MRVTNNAFLLAHGILSLVCIAAYQFTFCITQGKSFALSCHPLSQDVSKDIHWRNPKFSSSFKVLWSYDHAGTQVPVCNSDSTLEGFPVWDCELDFRVSKSFCSSSVSTTPTNSSSFFSKYVFNVLRITFIFLRCEIQKWNLEQRKDNPYLIARSNIWKIII